MNTPPETKPNMEFRSRTDERGTRKPMSGWDRSKFLILLFAVWVIGTWATLAQNAQQIAQREEALRLQDGGRGSLLEEIPPPVDPLTPRDAALINLRTGLLILFTLELLRQIHYFIAENSAGYNRFWEEKIWKGIARSTGRISDWNRFRIGRVLKWAVWIAIIDVILANALNTSPALALFQVPVIIFSALPYLLQALLFIFIFLSQFVAMFWLLSRGGIETFMPDDIKTRFTDVWGQDHVLKQVQENLLFLEDPEAIEEKGGYVPGGILLWGPPGTGKTLMAEAAAGETARPFVFVEPGAFVNTFFGIGIIKVKLLFRKLRKLALRHGGVVAFFDEADSLGNRGALNRGGPAGAPGAGAAPWSRPSPWASKPLCNGMGYVTPQTQSLLLHDHLRSEVEEGPRRGLRNRFIMGMGMGGRGDVLALTALLAEMSGLKKPRGFFNKRIRRLLGMQPKPPPRYRILIMMATNQPDALDEALLRPGRIDRIYRVGYPSKEGRKRTYQGYFDKVSHELSDQHIEKLAVITPYATGASIKDLVNESLIAAIRSGREVITWPDVVKARLLKSLGPPEDVEYIERERHAVAIHEACHAVAAYRVQSHLTIDIATIEKGQSYLGMVASIPPEEQFTQWRSEYDADLIVSVASLAGERIFFDGDSSSGVSGDLHNATTVSMYMEGFWGMGRGVGSHAVVKGAPAGSPIIDYNMLETGLGERVEEHLSGILRRAHELIERNRREVLAVAHALETHKTLTGDDVVAVIEGKPGPLIDGRPYASPGMLELLEHYHGQVVAAHKGHSRPASALPRFGPVQGDGVGGEAVASEESGR